jgi:signal transduction histidine kinase
LIDSAGATIGAIAIAQDITDTKKMEMTAESRRRLSELGALAASMAHEIRNPLNAIGITIQRMRNEIQPASGQNEYQKFLDGLKNEIKRLNDIIEKFLVVARSVRPEISNVNVRDLVAAAVEIFSNQAISQKVDLRWKAEPDIFIECDRSAVTQVLVNLIKNSLEALGSGGHIDISAEHAGEIVKISVIDDGPGISDPSLALKPFYTTKRDGTGLGLATASKIMADHGGELVIESSPGNGCRIDLLFRKQPIES